MKMTAPPAASPALIVRVRYRIPRPLLVRHPSGIEPYEQASHVLGAHAAATDEHRLANAAREQPRTRTARALDWSHLVPRRSIVFSRQNECDGTVSSRTYG